MTPEVVNIELAVQAYLSGSRADGMTDSHERNIRREALREAIDGNWHIGRVPQNAKPGVLIEKTNTLRDYHLAGEACDPQSIVEVITYAARGDIVQPYALWDWVRFAMTDYSGTWKYDAGEVTIYGCTVQPASERRLPPMKPYDGSDNWLAGFSGSFLITHNQPVPIG